MTNDAFFKGFPLSFLLHQQQVRRVEVVRQDRGVSQNRGNPAFARLGDEVDPADFPARFLRLFPERRGFAGGPVRGNDDAAPAFLPLEDKHPREDRLKVAICAS